MNRKVLLVLPPLFLTIAVVAVIGQQPPPPRLHKITQKGELKPVPATSTPREESEVTIEIVGDERVIRSNGIPNHMTGQFPNRGNPSTITSQNHEYRVPANPKVADEITPMGGAEFGVAVNGVPFDPGAGEFYDGEFGWQYEPLSGAIELGIDVSHAHVQPTGKYHYHGLPTGLLDSVKLQAGKHSPLIGWAADGFPIYAVYGYSDPKDAASPIQRLRSSYQLKAGERPGGNAPSGRYDGTFVRDYEYVAESGDLDECNGRFTVTPEFPGGTYAYFMTEQWPVVPRQWRGTPSSDFQHHGPGHVPGASGPGGQMARGPQGPGGFGGGPGFGSGPGFGGGPGQGRGPGAGQRLGRGQGPGMGQGGPPRPGEVLPAFLRQSLGLSDKQVKELDDLQALVDRKLKEILTDEQLQQLERGGPPGGRGNGPGFGGPPGGQRGSGQRGPGSGGFGGPGGRGRGR